jgi:hypothetical protein
MLQRSPMGDKPRPRRSQYTFFIWTAVAVVLVLLALSVWRGWGVTAAKLPQGPQGDLIATQATATQSNPSPIRPNAVSGSWNIRDPLVPWDR